MSQRQQKQFHPKKIPHLPVDSANQGQGQELLHLRAIICPGKDQALPKQKLNPGKEHLQNRLYI